MRNKGTKNKLRNSNETTKEVSTVSKTNESQISETTTQNDTSIKKEKKQRVSVVQLFQFSTFSEKILFVIAFIFSVSAGALQPISIIIYGKFISDLTTQINNSGIENNSKILDAVLPMIWTILYIGLAAMISGYISTCIWIRTGESQARRIRLKYLRSLLHQDMEWYDKMDQQNSLSSRMSSDTQLIQDGISENFGMMISNLSQFCAGFVTAFVKGWKLALIMLSILPLFFLIVVFYMMVGSKFTYKAQQSYGEAASLVEQALHSIRTIHSFSLQNRFRKLYGLKLKKVYEYGMRRCILTGFTYGLFNFCLFSSFGLTMWYGSKLVSKGEIDGGTVFVVFLAMTTGSIAVVKLMNSIDCLSQATAGAFHIFETIKNNPTIDNALLTDNNTSRLKGFVEFRNVTFSYPSRPDVTVLNNVTLDVSPGMTVAVVGTSGSGKSTLTHLIQRLYDPQDGEILIDGKNIKKLNVSFLRQHIGQVAQEPTLFNMTIRQNLTLGDETIDEQSIIRACEAANCHQFIIHMPNGYDTLLGESGHSMLSGGQKQRIAIARAILRDPRILLLDEATSALDTQSEKLVQEALEKASKGRATLIIAHRLSTIVSADCIVVLEKGHIVEKGNHDYLLQKGGVYANMIKNQVFESDKNESVLDNEFDTLELDYESKNVEKDFAENSKISIPTCVGSHDDELIDPIKGVASILSKKENTIIEYDRSKRRGLWKKLYKEMGSSEKRLLCIGAIAAFVASCIHPAYSYLFASVVSIITLPYSSWPNGALEGPNLYAFIFFFLGVAAFIGSGVQQISLAVFEENFTLHFRNLIFTTLLKQEISFFQKNESGTVKLKMDVDAKKISSMIGSVWGDVFQLIGTIVTGLTLSMLYSWELALVTLSIIPFLIASTSYEAYIQYGVQDKTKLANADSGKVATEAIREIKTVVLLNKQSYFEELYFQATKFPHDLVRRKAYLTSLGSGLQRGVLIFANALAFYVGTVLMVKGRINFQQMFTSMTVLISTAQAAGRFTMFATGLEKGKSAAMGIFDLFERQPSIDIDLEGLEPASIQGDVAFNQVKFAYPARPDQIILNGNFNLEITPGQTVALVGASGCGKSTVIGLLQRWYDPIEGEVVLDNHNVRKYSVKNLRSHMALVDQEPSLFDFTIAENLGVFGDEDEHDMQQVENACKASNIHDFIAGLPEKYHTRVGNMGSQLSGGQKQRIAIARALLQNPKILLLDEATSALDSESERLVQQTLDKIIRDGDKTIITIAHRLSTIKNADVICVVRNGYIVEQGTHTELSKVDGIYSSMLRQQNIPTTV